ncbi:hypothetical protein D1X54_00360 [Listeria monocytogenes]|nr:hypothetical protein [Listeria monocytogenes]
MYNQKCNEMSDSCRERLKIELIYIHSYTVCVTLCFPSQKSTHFRWLFMVYAFSFVLVTKSTYPFKLYVIFYIKFTYLSKYLLFRMNESV